MVNIEDEAFEASELLHFATTPAQTVEMSLVGFPEAVAEPVKPAWINKLQSLLRKKQPLKASSPRRHDIPLGSDYQKTTKVWAFNIVPHKVRQNVNRSDS
jgi:hypothetical protein